MADFQIFDEGSLIGFRPLTEVAEEWFEENVASEDWNWIGSICYVDHRPASAIMEAIEHFGMTMTI